MKELIFALGLFAIVACDGNGGSGDRDCIDCIWTNQSQRIVITESNRGANGAPRIFADYTRDTMPSDVWKHIRNMSITTEPFDVSGTLFSTFRVFITEETGVEKVYYDNYILSSGYPNLDEIIRSEGLLFFDHVEVEILYELLGKP